MQQSSAKPFVPFIIPSILVMTLFLYACTSATKLSVKDQETVQATYQKKTFYLKYPVYVGPFYAYEDRWLLSERAFDERVLIQTPSGEPILPPDPTNILPLGTKVIIREIEFPTGSAIISRKLKSPRHFTWVMLELENTPQSKPHILVLTQEMRQIREFRSALEHYLVSKDPRKEFIEVSAKVRKAIDTKTLIKGMSASALLRSRGQPDKRSRVYKDGVKIETWQYTPNRIVNLKDDRVERWEGFPSLEVEPSHHIDSQSTSSTSTEQ